MKKSRLRLYILLSLVLHILLLWALRFLPASDPASLSPVAIRFVPPSQDGPRPPAARQKQARKPPEPQPQKPQPQEPPPTVAKPPPPPPKQGGVLAELPKPVQEQRPDDARLLSQYDSVAQDVGPNKPGAQKPAGEKPPDMPPELALPERYSAMRPTPPPVEVQPPTPPPPQPARPQPAPKPPVTPPQSTPQQQARLLPTPEPRPQPEAKRQPENPGTIPMPTPEKPPEPLPPRADPRFRITTEQELAMLQRERDQQATERNGQQTFQEHFARLDKRQPLPSFDAPGVYERGPERPGEGQGETGGGKYQSIDSFGLQHFSYLIGVKRKIELVFSVPFFAPSNGGVGVPIVGFTIRRNGELAEAVLLRSSGYAIVDKALLEAIKRAAPYGPFPEHLPEPEISIRVYATIS